MSKARVVVVRAFHSQLPSRLRQMIASMLGLFKVKESNIGMVMEKIIVTLKSTDKFGYDESILSPMAVVRPGISSLSVW